MYNIRKEKIELRKKMLKKRDKLNIAELKDRSFDIKQSLFNLDAFKKANNIMFFVSFRSEVMTDFMIKEALDEGKKIIVPRVEKHSHSLKIFHLNDFNTDLTFGAYGILEPKSDQCKRARKTEPDIIIIPGAVFTKKGERVGYGLGYYDRFLEKVPERALKIGLAFELQIVNKVPASEQDIKMDMVITEKRVINCKE